MDYKRSIEYMWRVVDDEDITVALFIIKADAEQWASTENEKEPSIYKIVEPKLKLRDTISL